jgi:hypothetical protein
MPAPPKIVPADPALWRKAFLNLRPSVVPCPGFTLQSWGGAHEACVDFLDRWADQAATFGWTTLECFGVHPQVGTIRPDFCGAMVLGGEKVSAVLDDRIAFERTTYRRDKPGRPSGAVPLWLFGR